MLLRSSDVSGSSSGFEREVVVQRLRQQRQRVDLQRQLVDHGHLVLGLGLGCGADRRRKVAEAHLVRIAAGFRRFVADRGIAFLGGCDVARGGEDHLAPSSRKALATAGGAGLDDDGMALRRARHGERPARLVVFALVVEPLDLGRIGEAAARLVHDQRTVFPGVPMAQHDFHEFVGAVVAVVMFEMGILAHVVGFAVIERGDDVPSRASARHQIEGGEAARDVERLEIGGRAGRSQPELCRDHAHRGQARSAGPSSRSGCRIRRCGRGRCRSGPASPVGRRRTPCGICPASRILAIS